MLNEGFLLSIVVLMGWIASVCLHEFGHAIVAYYGGDFTVKDKGYLTLNPLKYTDIGYSVILPVVFLMLGGIALPGAAVYINTSLLRHRFWNSAVSAAGPAATLMVAIALSLPFRLGWNPEAQWLGTAIALLASLQVAGFFFNLFPIPPFDGFGIIEPWLPTPIQQLAHRWGRYGYLVLLTILWIVPPANRLFWQLVNTAGEWLLIPNERVIAGFISFQRSSPLIFLGVLLFLLLFRRQQQSKEQPAHSQPDSSPETQLAECDRALAVGQATAQLWSHRGNLLSQLQRDEEAIASYDEALKLNPNAVEIWDEKAIVLLSLGRHEEGLQHYETALKLSPTHKNSLSNKAHILFILRRYPEAIVAYNAYLKLNPTSVDHWCYLGQLYVEQQNFNEALSSYEKALKYKPTQVDIWTRYVSTLNKMQQYEQAAQSVQQALKFNPQASEPSLFFQEGTALYHLKRYEKAIAALDKCLQDEFLASSAYYNQACCYALLGQSEQALDCLEKAVQKADRSIQEEILADKDFQTLRSIPRFQALSTVSPKFPETQS